MDRQCGRTSLILASLFVSGKCATWKLTTPLVSRKRIQGWLKATGPLNNNAKFFFPTQTYLTQGCGCTNSVSISSYNLEMVQCNFLSYPAPCFRLSKWIQMFSVTLAPEKTQECTIVRPRCVSSSFINSSVEFAVCKEQNFSSVWTC